MYRWISEKQAMPCASILFHPYRFVDIDRIVQLNNILCKKYIGD